jgi:hypothetical protein
MQDVLPVIQSIGIVGSLLLASFALRVSARTARVQSLLTITSSHREIWRAVAAKPELSAALADDADPAAMTGEQRQFVREVILHLAACFEAARLGSLPVMEHMDSDVQQLLSRPVPRAVWNELKPYQNSRFVSFVEDQLSAARSPSRLPH